LQTGTGDAQVLSFTQATHWAVAALQTGVAPPHELAFVAEQVPHAPFGWQAGAPAGQSASAAQARQAWVPASQVGLAPLQSEAVRQATHAWGADDVMQSGVVPEQSLLVAHPSTMTGVGGAPEALPLPSET